MNTGPDNRGAFWRSPAGLVLGVFLVVAGLLLVLEHGAHLLGASPLLLLLGVCIGMHFFMHGGHGSHRDDHAGHGKERDDER
jgi:uncharacterized membrane protein